jgi:hypothetical protein
MAVSVAPLTTTVMNSVSENRAGIASGINNAVSRTAGLLSIAVLGVVMFQSFNACLDEHLAQLPISSEVRRTIDSERIKLAALELPAQVSEETRTAFKQTVNDCFVYGFRRVMLIGVGLALASSLTAFMMLRGRRSSSSG